MPRRETRSLYASLRRGIAVQDEDARARIAPQAVEEILGGALVRTAVETPAGEGGTEAVGRHPAPL